MYGRRAVIFRKRLGGFVVLRNMCSVNFNLPVSTSLVNVVHSVNPNVLMHLIRTVKVLIVGMKNAICPLFKSHCDLLCKSKRTSVKSCYLGT